MIDWNDILSHQKVHWWPITWNNDLPSEEVDEMSTKWQTYFSEQRLKSVRRGTLRFLSLIRQRSKMFHGTWIAPTTIFIGQTCRYKCICRTIKEFKAATHPLTLRMIEMKHSPMGMKKRFRISSQQQNIYGSARLHWFGEMLEWAMRQRTGPFTVIIVHNRPRNEFQDQTLEVETTFTEKMCNILRAVITNLK